MKKDVNKSNKCLPHILNEKLTTIMPETEIKQTKQYKDGFEKKIKNC